MYVPQSIERIIAFGGSVSIDASKYVPSSLERFAAIAARSGAHIEMRNCDQLIPVTLERIASIGRGAVKFHLN